MTRTDVETPPAVAQLFDRHAAQLYRYCARRVGTGVDPLTQDGHETRAAERIDAAFTARRIAGALAGLARIQRDVLWLYGVAELSYAEISQALGVPLGTVQSSLHRARTRMRQALTANVED